MGYTYKNAVDTADEEGLYRLEKFNDKNLKFEEMTR